jgi:hypothetical protein
MNEKTRRRSKRTPGDQASLFSGIYCKRPQVGTNRRLKVSIAIMGLDGGGAASWGKTLGQIGDANLGVNEEQTTILKR